jgi:tetratricopeptide (TPR) repeat protein
VAKLPANHRVWVTEGATPSKIEPFKAFVPEHDLHDSSFGGESLPDVTETWLLAPIMTPNPSATDSSGGPRLLTFSTSEPPPSDDTAAIYNLLFRTLFDRHRDMPLPTSFLLDEAGQIVKVYQGPVSEGNVKQDISQIPRTDSARLSKALPFSGIADTFEFGRNYLSLGSVFFQRGYADAAGGFFQAALKDSPDSAEALYGLGSVYMKQEKNSQAGDCFEQAVKLKASYRETTPNAWNNLGILATRKGDTVKAIHYFEQALRLNQDHFIALENLGNAYRQQKRWEEAESTLEHALALKPDDPDANYSLGMVLAQNNDAAAAYEHLQKALQARPIFPEALNNLGILYLRTHRRDEAVSKFEECMRVAPSFEPAYLNLARVYAIEGNSQKARTVLEGLLAVHPDSAAGRQALEQLH